MTGYEFGRLAYLGIFLAAIAGIYLLQSRASWRRGLVYAATWALIFLGVIAAVGLWDDIRGAALPRQAVFSDAGHVELPRARDGHYYVSLDINGSATRFVVDTGASGMVLTREDAARAGIDLGALPFHGSASTANGMVRTAPVVLDEVALGPFTDRNVRAYVNEGDMHGSLLGMSYLQRFSRLEIANGRLILER
ncbi:aspartyl protease [Salipiger pallidus]|uniref:Aspartyl protease n=1 Tax=Salipiger pallidus TaxID=1775170 RepID=A0A8J2ZGC5_9RHOB|nr:TIGR02281 family clan AA aspartic protease [Salipiger pallidus]GGG59309.1 aspartyl protease [Salipiger pallidus]